MPISPISPVFDLINILRTPSVSLQNLVDSGTDFNINLNGNQTTSWTNLGSAFPTETRSAGCSLNGGDYLLSGEIDWTNIILPIPNGALITRVEIFCRLNYNLVTNVNNTVNAGTDNQCSSFTDVDGITDPGAEVVAPNSVISPDTDDTVSASDSELVDTAAALSSSAVINNPGTILRKIWDLTTQPGGGISRAALLAQFTETGILLRLSRSQSTAQWATGLGELATGEANAIFQLTTGQWYMRVTWSGDFNWTLNPPEFSAVQEDDLITITSTEPDALLLNQLTIEMGGVAIAPITQTPNELTFTVPALPAGPTPIIATGNGVQFSGSVGLGVLEIIGADVSGIYVLSPSALNDTLYSSARDGSVTERAIPNPFIKTGFVGG